MVIAMAVGIIALLEIVSPAALTHALYPLTAMTASAVSVAFSVLDLDVARTGFVFAHCDGFAYEIHYRCTGFWPVLLLAGLIGADGTDLRGARRAIIIGAGILLSLNYVRLLSLFWVGVEFPGYFALAHGALWPLAMIAAVLGLWLSMRRREPASLSSVAV